tara:strand:+ start:11097 stop:12101 length:1005 start_codon:yes stop_codon:yes gene_type:complete
MDFYIPYKEETLKKFINKRPGETKFGESVVTINNLQDLNTSSAQYVLLGIPEDVGVRANRGIAGTSNAWNACLKALLNMQANIYTNPENLVVLGEINCKTEMKAAETLDKEEEHYYEELSKIVNQIDIKVATVIEHIVQAGKTPVIIGGGHNNSYGNIKGTSLALKKPVSVVNFDAHSDFRNTKNRHSGNGFSCAYEQGFLKHYFIFGLHKNYSSQSLFDRLHESKENIHYILFEQIKLTLTKPFEQALADAEDFMGNNKFGLELDLDAVQSIPSSAKTPSGFSVNDTRRFVSFFSNNSNVAYLHLCEAAPHPGTDAEKQTGKLLAYLVIDFMG